MDNTDEDLQIRVITPKLANQNKDQTSIPLLNDGCPIPVTTTLRELKQLIAASFGESIYLPAPQPEHHECNCTLAGSIAQRGIWEMLRCRDHKEKNCQYPHGTFGITEECLLCRKELRQPCISCGNQETDAINCALVTNAGCQHKFHHHCYVHAAAFRRAALNNACPAGCSIGTVLEMKSNL
jgi:hypothetical protein